MRNLSLVEAVDIDAYAGAQIETERTIPPRLQEHASAEAQRLVGAYRDYGYLRASTNPLDVPLARPEVPELAVREHELGLGEGRRYRVELAAAPSSATVPELLQSLQASYCGTVSLNCAHVRNRVARKWLYEKMEQREHAANPTKEVRLHILEQLVAAEAFEKHLKTTFPAYKTFGLEGSETLVPLLNALIEEAARAGAEDVVLGMAHRGRLNVLRNVMELSADHVLSLFSGTPHAELAAWDLKDHVGCSTPKRTRHGDVNVMLAHNPSHLESVVPVVCGIARALQDGKRDGFNRKVTPILVHGDAAFCGQGIVAEALNLSQTAGYRVGGTVHVILNNQVGSTMGNPRDTRSTLYCGDLGRVVDAPIIQVNADDPEAAHFAAGLATGYRAVFGADIVIDLVGYRRYGHYGQDDPSITQPAMQRCIDAHPGVVALYCKHLARDGEVSAADIDGAAASADGLMLESKCPASPPSPHILRAVVESTTWNDPSFTAVPEEQLRGLVQKLANVPHGFALHPEVCKVVEAWTRFAQGEDDTVDWRLGENLAYATLLANGYNVRLSGIDVGRGSFFHRQTIWHHQSMPSDGANIHVPLRHLSPQQGYASIFESPLSEEAVLGFEYGYSLRSGRDLVIWEAQLGDFVNNAQVIIDQYISTGEAKWGYQSGLVALLPHGHEGAGPEHSSAFIGRFLALCADNNMRVAMPSTPAQLYHLLRRQALVEERKPLIVMTPKSWTYAHKPSYSTLADLASGEFRAVLAEPGALAREHVTRVVLTSGKLYYDVAAEHRRLELRDTTILRVEQLYPFPVSALGAELALFPRLAEVVWTQEEHKNHGAWYLVRESLEAALPRGVALSYAGRAPAAPSAVCNARQHAAEQRTVVRQALRLAVV